MKLEICQPSPTLPKPTIRRLIILLLEELVVIAAIVRPVLPG